MIEPTPTPSADWYSILRATRPINLLLLAWALISLRFFLMLPVLETRLLNFGLDHSDFMLMVLGATLIAAAGNLINDFFDHPSDLINLKNRPHLAENIFWPVYWGLNGVGLSLCAWAAWRAGLLNLTLLPIAAVFMLFRYSEQWKKQGWWGTLTIVILCCLWVTLPWLYEFKAMGILYQYYRSDSNMLHITLLVYLVFCALVTMCRELIKACEDHNGDRHSDTLTVAVQYGPVLTSRLAAGFWLLVWSLNTMVALWQWYHLAYFEALYSTLLWSGATLVMWKFISLWNLARSHPLLGAVPNPEAALPILPPHFSNLQSYKNLSRYLKLYFAAGILSMWVYYMIFLYGALTP